MRGTWTYFPNLAENSRKARAIHAKSTMEENIRFGGLVLRLLTRLACELIRGELVLSLFVELTGELMVKKLQQQSNKGMEMGTSFGEERHLDIANNSWSLGGRHRRKSGSIE